MITTFVVGQDENQQVVRFTLVMLEGSPNIRTLDPLPPLNRTGLFRLAKHLEALATLIECGQGHTSR